MLADTSDVFRSEKEATASDGPVSRRERLNSAAILTTAKLLPLVQLLDAIQPHVASESVFRARRRKLDAHLKEAYAELRAENPRRRALLHVFKVMGELVVEETRDISPDELRQAAKEVVLATLKNAPGLISAAHQARVRS